MANAATSPDPPAGLNGPAARRRAYHAFISYSHAADDRLAPALQTALHRFAKPWWRMRALRVFRDKSSLAADPQLWGAIERALADSEWFILLASPQAARSHWVNQECEWWLRHRAARRMLIVLTEGDLAWDRGTGDFDATRTTAVPPALLGRFSEEPNHVDLRFAKAQGSEDQRSLRHAGFRAAILDLAAPIHGVSKDLLDGEDVRQHRRVRWLAGAALAAMAVLAALAGWAAVQATRQATEAERGRLLAESRQMAARSQALLGDGHVDTALLHAVEARRVMPPEVQAATGEWFGWYSSLLASVTDRGAPLRALFQNAGLATLSEDGQTLATASGPTVALWDARTHRQRRQFQSRFQFVSSLALSPDGQVLVLASQLTEDVAFIDTASGQEIGSIAAADADNGQLAMSPDGRWLAVHSGTAITLWDPATRQPKPLRLPAHGDIIVAAAFDRASSRLVYGSTDGQVTAVDLVAGAVLPRQLDLPAGLRALALSADGGLMAAGGKFGLVVWDLRRNQPVWRDADVGRAAEDRAAHDVGVESVRPTPSPAEARVAAMAGSVTAVAISPEGSMVATGNNQGVIKRWRLARAPEDELQSLGEPITLHRQGIGALMFGPDGKTLLSSGDEQLAALWDLGRVHSLADPPAGGAPAWQGEGLRAQRLVGHAGQVMTATCTAPDTGACTGLSIGLWDAGGRRIAQHAIEQASTVFGQVLLGPSGTWLVTETHHDGSDGETPAGPPLRLWRLGEAAPVSQPLPIRADFGPVVAIDISKDGRTLAVSNLNQVAVLNLPDGSALGTLPVGRGALAFSPDGQRLAVAEGITGAPTLSVYEARSLRVQAVLALEIDRVEGLAWSADGQWLAVFGDDAAFALYEVDTRRRIGPVQRWSGSSPRDLAFAADRNTVRVLDGSPQVLRFDLAPAALQALACRMANRNLSLEEWAALKGPACYRASCPDLPPDPALQPPAEGAERTNTREATPRPALCPPDPGR